MFRGMKIFPKQCVDGCIFLQKLLSLDYIEFSKQTDCLIDEKLSIIDIIFFISAKNHGLYCWR